VTMSKQILKVLIDLLGQDSDEVSFIHKYTIYNLETITLLEVVDCTLYTYLQLWISV